MPQPAGDRHRTLRSPLGDLVIAAGTFDGKRVLTGVWFTGQKYFPAASVLGEPDRDGDFLLAAAATQLSEWFAGERKEFDLPLALEQRPQALRPRVWRALLEVPYGRTTTYGRIAVELGGRGHAQAVGQAVGHNPWSIVVPCHRVLGSDGDLTGYAGGLTRKRALLAMEGSIAEEPSLF